MPQQRKRAYRKKRNYTRKRKWYNKRRSVRKSVLPSSFTTKMIYNETIFLDGGSFSTPARYTFRGNSINDPNLTGTGHQALGHDNFSAFFKEYCVIGAKLTAKVVNGSALNDDLLIGIHNGTDSADIFSNVNHMVESGMATYKIHCDNANKPLTLVSKQAPLKMLKKKISEDTVRAAFNANPVDQTFFNLYAANIGDTSDPATICVNVKIEYIVKCMSPITPEQS